MFWWAGLRTFFVVLSEFDNGMTEDAVKTQNPNKPMALPLFHTSPKDNLFCAYIRLVQLVSAVCWAHQYGGGVVPLRLCVSLFRAGLRSVEKIMGC